MNDDCNPCVYCGESMDEGLECHWDGIEGIHDDCAAQLLSEAVENLR